ncbi:MAG TPA: UDP-N-acetylmuramate--L-alanine ligase [Bacteroidetes bacterium]|nr:UDP-N-acetylmuramate--L-alanine ligase [Bacteroidota bacterium]
MHNERPIAAVYFLGIGGIGMSALARYYHALGYRVAGYDKTPSPLLEELQESGIEVVYDDKLSSIPDSISQKDPDDVLWVYTPAIPDDHPQLLYLKSKGVELLKRAQVLGRITKGRMTLAVAGTHGKTTTSTLLAHLLREGGIDCTAFLGGISGNYGTNYLQAKNADTAPVVVEADEFDRSFLQLQPNKAIITSVDADHLDIYATSEAFRKGFEDFARLLPSDGLLVQKEGLELSSLARNYSYSVEGQGEYRAENIRIVGGNYVFDLVTNDTRIDELTLGLPGRHNMENAVAASAIALSMGVSRENLSKGLASFKGVKRRFEYIIKEKSQTFIDDYAHHPEELKACISSIQELFPNQPVCGIFQPHLYSRTRDFMDGFAESLSLLDTCLLLPIYPARERPIKGIDSQALLEKLSCREKLLLEPDEVLKWISAKRPKLIVTLGAGDIDRLVPQIREVLQ